MSLTPITFTVAESDNNPALFDLELGSQVGDGKVIKLWGSEGAGKARICVSRGREACPTCVHKADIEFCEAPET